MKDRITAIVNIAITLLNLLKIYFLCIYILRLVHFYDKYFYLEVPNGAEFSSLISSVEKSFIDQTWKGTL
jgi:hypothetical protein